MRSKAIIDLFRGLKKYELSWLSKWTSRDGVFCDENARARENKKACETSLKQTFERRYLEI